MPTRIRLSPGAVVPRDMREWATWAASARADYIRNGQTGYDSGTGYFLGDDNGTPKLSIGNSDGHKVTWDGSTLSIVGNIVLGSGNFLRSGQTAYDTGTGFWIGNDGGTPKFSIGDSAANKLTWDGSALRVVGQFEFGNIQTFTPSWSGFSTAPTGDLYYTTIGGIALIWSPSGHIGTSDANTYTITSGVPADIRPASNSAALVSAVDNATATMAQAVVGSAGSILFSRSIVSGSNMNFSSSGWTTSGNKGLATGALMMYPFA